MKSREVTEPVSQEAKSHTQICFSILHILSALRLVTCHDTWVGHFPCWHLTPGRRAGQDVACGPSQPCRAGILGRVGEGKMAVTSFRLTWNHGNLNCHHAEAGQLLFFRWVSRMASVLIKSFNITRNNTWNGHRCTQTASKKSSMPRNESTCNWHQ